MKIFVEGVSVFEETFETTDSLIDRYSDDEIDQGREVPRYAWETLVIVVGGWLLKKVADQLFSWAVEYRGRAKAQEKEQKSEATEERRHRELLQKLETLLAPREPPQGEVEWLRALMSEGRIAIEIHIDTEAEADLIPALQQHLRAIDGLIIRRHDQPDATPETE